MLIKMLQWTKESGVYIIQIKSFKIYSNKICFEIIIIKQF